MANDETHGQVLGSTKSKKLAQVEAKSKKKILFLIIMLRLVSRRSNIKNSTFGKIHTSRQFTKYENLTN